MGSFIVRSMKIFLLFVFIPSTAFSFEFDVGGEGGWVVPPSNNSQLYNQWASKNRFNAGDIVRFRYKKDSVLVVTEEEYEKCKSTRPCFFSNNGDTEYKFKHSGTYYFISGSAGHCEQGQKMIIRVISHSDSPGTSPPSPASSNVVSVSALVFAPLIGTLLFYGF